MWLPDGVAALIGGVLGDMIRFVVSIVVMLGFGYILGFRFGTCAQRECLEAGDVGHNSKTSPSSLAAGSGDECCCWLVSGYFKPKKPSHFP